MTWAFHFWGLHAKEAAGVRAVIFTGSSVLEIVVALVVEHLIGVGEDIHGSIQELEGRKMRFW